MKNKKLTAFILGLTLLSTTLTLVPPTPSYSVEAATVKINKTSSTIEEGKTLQLKISGTSSKITWKSSKPSIASVSSKGKVTANKKGTATITATVNKKKYTCKITVKDKTLKFTFDRFSLHDPILDYIKTTDIKLKANNEFSHTVTMTKAQHKELLKQFKVAYSNYFDEFMEDRPYYKSITANKDYTSFTVIVDGDTYLKNSMNDALYLELLFPSTTYQVFNGVSYSKTLTNINVFDQDTNEMIDHFNYEAEFN